MCWKQNLKAVSIHLSHNSLFTISSHFSSTLSLQSLWNTFKSPHVLAARVILMMLELSSADGFTLLRHINKHLKVYLSACVKRYRISERVFVCVRVC